MKHKKSSSKFWFILGIFFILLDPVLAHLSNANIIKWPDALNSEKITTIISRILIGSGIIFLIIAFIKSYSTERSN